MCKIWKVIDKRLLSYLVDNDVMWILIDVDGNVKKVGDYKSVKKLMSEGDVRYKLKRMNDMLVG